MRLDLPMNPSRENCLPQQAGDEFRTSDGVIDIKPRILMHGDTPWLESGIYDIDVLNTNSEKSERRAWNFYTDFNDNSISQGV